MPTSYEMFGPGTRLGTVIEISFRFRMEKNAYMPEIKKILYFATKFSRQKGLDEKWSQSLKQSAYNANII